MWFLKPSGTANKREVSRLLRGALNGMAGFLLIAKEAQQNKDKQAFVYEQSSGESHGN